MLSYSDNQTAEQEFNASLTAGENMIYNNLLKIVLSLTRYKK